jgi:hypothetical protein
MLVPRWLYFCAVGLGRTVVKVLKDQIRVDLPFEIKGQAATLESEVIQAIVEKCVSEGNPSRRKDTSTANTEEQNLTLLKANLFLYSTLKTTVHRSMRSKIKST